MIHLGSHAKLFFRMKTLSQKSIKQSPWHALLEGATLVEQDNFGPKVYELPDARMIKLFRVKRFWSSNLWSPYARRFVKNSERLKRLGITSVNCLQWGRVPHLDRGYVIYQKLLGTTIQSTLEVDASVLGNYYAHLHQRGVYFRSCHLGNLILLENQDIGLIDVLDIRFRSRPLTENERERNFRHLLRRPQDRERLNPLWETFQRAYQQASSL